MDSEKLISIKATFNGTTKETEVNRNNLTELKDLYTLVASLFEIKESIVIQRKSKRSRNYVTVATISDFKSLKRSLDVKDHLKLKVFKETNELGNEFKSDINFKLDSIMSKIVELSTGINKPKTNDGKTYVHEGIYCDICEPYQLNQKYIVGNRYQCLDCADYDLCEFCYQGGKFSGSHRCDHKMEKLTGLRASHDKDGYIYRDQGQEDSIKVTNNMPKTVDYFIDIPIKNDAFKDELINLVHKYDTASKIVDLVDKSSKYDKLIELFGDSGSSFDNLYQSVYDSIENKKKSKQITSNPELTCQISKMDNYLFFQLTNKSEGLTPKDLKLRFTYLSSNSNLIKFNLNIQEQILAKGGVKSLKYNLNGIDWDFIVSKTHYTIELFDNDKIYASGSCLDSSGFAYLNNSILLTNLSKLNNEDINSKSSLTSSENSSLENLKNEKSQVLETVDSVSLTEIDVDDQDTMVGSFQSEGKSDEDFITSNETDNNSSSTTEDISVDFIDVNMDDVITEDDSDDNDHESLTDRYEVLSTDDSYDSF
ncbi:hypothetical protein WICMUC_000500 [Wickerhamomyces mucosus]|uniref:ZZ-type domain-containing protein n=1 Tax=Wickerhamomyces mucosus TaxID=1378264 RepID=A0A9P8PZM3_9ASCO|nr:hypothetical protein WICMUC_000500 [Wickerhamomyces mucosus]